MTLQERVRELDERYVPVLAERARSMVDKTAAERIAALEQARHLAATKPGEWEQRYAGSRLLQLVREIPQIGFVIIAAVFLAGTATAVVRHRQPRQQSADEQVVQEPSADAGNRLGPEVGETTTGYEATSFQDLEHLADTAPTSTRLALVSLRRYATPAEVTALLGSFQVRRIYLRASAGGPEAAQLPYDIHGELSSSLRRAYADVALSRLAVRRSYLAYVATTTDDKAYHDDYAAFAASTGREVVAYQHSCACVFSVVVEAPARDLLALRARPAVRALQVAGKDQTLTNLVILPLLPETVGLVTKGPVTEAP